MWRRSFVELFSFTINDFSPVEEQIYFHLKNTITETDYEVEETLPSPRDLAIHLRQSVTDVFSAYKQLEIEGYVERIGDDFKLVQLHHSEEKVVGYKSKVKKEESILPYDFKVDIVDKKFFPLARWKECLSEATEETSIYSQGFPNGEPELKIALAKHFKRHRQMDVSPDNIFISSSIQALLTRLAMFFKSNNSYNSFIIENPGNKEAFSIFQSLGYHAQTYRVLPDGHQISEIPNKKSLLYVTPSQQQPLGITIPVKKRVQLIAWAKKNNCLIIEDDNDSEFRYNATSIAPMASINSSHVIYVNSFARSFLPSIRVAFSILPDQYVEDYMRFNEDFEQNASSLAQIALANFLEEGYFNDHLKKMTSIYDQKMAVLSTTIQMTFPSTFRVFSDDSGQYLLIQPNNGMTEDELISSAAELGVKVYRFSTFYLDDDADFPPLLMLGFGSLNRLETRDGVKRLYKAWFES